MSTKTTLKRIALVAVSALGIGLLSVVPARATMGNGDIVVTPASSSAINTTGSQTLVVTVSADLDAAESFGLYFQSAIGSGATLAATTAFSWKILEHSSNLSATVYQGVSTAAAVPADQTAITDATGAGGTLLVQVQFTSVVDGNSLIVDGTTGAGAYVNGTTVYAVSTKTITNKALTTNVATLTTSVAHGFAINDIVTVSGVDSTFNGVYTVTGVTSTTFTYAKIAANVTSVASTGGSASITDDANDTPWRINAVDAPTTTITSSTSPSSMAATSVVAATTNDVRIKSVSNTAPKAGSGSYRYVEVTGSTIKAVAGGVVIDGAPNVSNRALVNVSGALGATSEVWINAATAGTITVRFIDRSQVTLTGSFYETILQTITYTVSAPGAVSRQLSTSTIHALNDGTSVATDAPTVTTYSADFETVDLDSLTAGVQAGDMTILAPATANGEVAKAVIQVELKDALGAAIVGTMPAVSVAIAGPGTLSVTSSAVDPNTSAATTLDDSVGRSLTLTAAPTATFYVNVFSDGTSGSSTVNISVAGELWRSETLKFYSTPTTITATPGVKVVKAGGTAGCTTTGLPALVACDGTLVANTVGVSVTVSDANGIPVPYKTVTATSSNTAIITGSTKTVDADWLGTKWYTVSGATNAASGSSATVTYSTTTTGTSTISTAAVPFAIGGAAASATLSVTTGKGVGEKGTMTFTVKDSAGNAAFDKDHLLDLTSNLALTGAVGQIAPTNNKLKLIGGSATLDFFNPSTPGTVSVTGLIDGALAVGASFTVIDASIDAVLAAALKAIAAAEAAQDAAVAEAAKATAQAKAAEETAAAAVDAAAEAIDAANAATDAANLAAEAADAATVAAEEARDAADAATAAIEELATQVASLMAALKAQIATLANTVAKIAKKVKA